MADIVTNAANIIGSNAATRRREFLIGYANAKAGDIVVLNASNQWIKTDANGGLGTNFGDTVGMLEAGGNTNQPTTVITEDPNLALGAILANGVIYMASPNAGNFAPSTDLTTGNVALVLGVGRTPSTMYFRPITAGATI